MGITIDNYPVYGGITDISGVYVYVRDIQTTKRSTGEYTLNYVGFYVKDVSGSSQRLDIKSYNDVSSNPYTDTWTLSYNNLKTKLDDLSLSYVDS